MTMDTWGGQPPAEKKNKRWLTCLVGCLIVAGVAILFFLIIAFILLRAHAPVREETFFTPAVTGFARVQLDALKNQAVKELLRAVIKSEPIAGSNQKESDPEQILFYIGFILHEKHFIYIYPDEQEETSDFMAVINIKRLSWLVSSMLSDKTSKNIRKIPPPANIKARCFRIDLSSYEAKAEKENNDSQRPIFLAVAPRAVIFSNSQLRMNDGLALLFAPKNSEDLSPLARALLPSPNSDDFINGFGIWQKKWNINFVKNLKEQYPDAANDLNLAETALDKTHFKGASFKCNLISSNVLNLSIEILCTSERESVATAEILNQKIKPLMKKENWEIEIYANKNKINALIEISGIEEKLIEGMKEK